MFDLVDPICVPETAACECPGCGAPFAPKRSNQQYCCRDCQRRTTRNASRGNRASENRQRSWQHYERAARLTEMIYTTPPQERLGIMNEILTFVPTDAGLRNILTDHELHMERPQADGKMNIAKAANAYTQRFYGVSIATYLQRKRKGETLNEIEVSRKVLHGPAPRLRPKLTAKNVRCWHKTLIKENAEKAQQRVDDFIRVDAIVADTLNRQSTKGNT